MSKKPTQMSRVVDYITEFGSITRVEAMMDLGIANLPAVVDDLRHRKGVAIITNEVKAKNRYDENITYAKYTLGEDKDGSKEFGD